MVGSLPEVFSHEAAKNGEYECDDRVGNHDEDGLIWGFLVDDRPLVEVWLEFSFLFIN